MSNTPSSRALQVLYRKRGVLVKRSPSKCDDQGKKQDYGNAFRKNENEPII